MKHWKPHEHGGFYGRTSWKNLREAYIKQHGLCERCLARGIIKAAEFVHHIIPIDEDNLNDPSITLNPDNLMAVCRQCHEDLHAGTGVYGPPKKRRYTIGPDGKVSVNPPCHRKN